MSGRCAEVRCAQRAQFAGPATSGDQQRPPPRSPAEGGRGTGTAALCVFPVTGKHLDFCDLPSVLLLDYEFISDILLLKR